MPVLLQGVQFPTGCSFSIHFKQGLLGLLLAALEKILSFFYSKRGTKFVRKKMVRSM